MDAKKLNNQEKLDHMFEMVNELNHEMHELKKKESAESAYRLFYMTIVVIALGGVYYFVSPLFEAIKKAPEIIDTATQKVNELKKLVPDSNSISNKTDILQKITDETKNLPDTKILLDTAKEKALKASQ